MLKAIRQWQTDGAVQADMSEMKDELAEGRNSGINGDCMRLVSRGR